MTTIEVNVPNYGTLRGSVDQARQIAVFRNVPYAVVPERWRAAVKPQPWSDVRDATKQGPICPQSPSSYPLYLLYKDSPQYQDQSVVHDEKHGLNLNIFVPLKSLQSGAEPVPVMTWLHGGGFRDGSNALPIYDASNFVEHSIQLNQPVIVVTVNYRLNVFGFLASKELEDEMKLAATGSSISTYDQSIGNWGLMDQKLAFEWVRGNIAAFGGNQRNVTAWGESAGSISIHYHMLCPAHHGLFDHAIMESGTVATLPPGLAHKEGQASFDALLGKLDISLELDGPEKMKRLRAVPSDQLTKAALEAQLALFSPFYDGGKVLPSKVPIYALARDRSAYDPNVKTILIGTTKDEGTAIARMSGNPTLQAWSYIVEKLVPIPEMVPTFATTFGEPKTDEDAANIASRFIGDLIFQHPTQTLVDKLAEWEQFEVTRYRFDVAIKKMDEYAPGFGALHAGELPFIFCPDGAKEFLTEEEQAVSKKMQAAWIGFANQAKNVAKDGKIHFTIEKAQWEGVYVSGKEFKFCEDITKAREHVLSAALH